LLPEEAFLSGQAVVDGKAQQSIACPRRLFVFSFDDDAKWLTVLTICSIVWLGL
jgi:hypothetical protein